MRKMRNIFIDEDDDDFFEEMPWFYPPWLLLNIPPIATPLGDDGSWYGDGSMSYIPKLPYEFNREEMHIAYLGLHNILSDLDVFERKFLMKVLIMNMMFKTARAEDVCISLLGYMPVRIKREMCRDALRDDYLNDYIERIGEFLVVKREVWREILEEKGEKLYELYSIFLNSLLKRMRSAVQRPSSSSSPSD